MGNVSGMVAAIAAFFLWGILPVYWKALQNVTADEILCHRMVWSLVFTMGLIVILRRGRSLVTLLKKRRNIAIYGTAAILLAGNWLLYIWAVNAGHVIEASLGYFINPLISVLFGVLFLSERMRKFQCVALLFALVGVIYLTVVYGKFPWVALCLACSFAIYGLLHKKTEAPALEALCVETLVLFLPALMFLVWRELRGEAAFGHTGTEQALLLFGAGLITSLPLLLFGYAARKISLTHLGLLQYLAPTINLFLGIFLYAEPFPMTRMIGFMFIWAGLLLYVGEGLFLRRKRRLRTA